MAFIDFGIQVAFLLPFCLESAAKHSSTLQRLKTNNQVDLEINNLDKVIPASRTLNMRKHIKENVFSP